MYEFAHSPDGEQHPGGTYSEPQLIGRLLDVSQYISSITDAAGVVSHLIERMVDIFPTLDAGVLWVYESTPSSLRVASLYAIDPAVATHMERIRLRVNEGLAGIAFRRGLPMSFIGRERYREMSSNLSQDHRPVIDMFIDTLPEQVIVVVMPLHIGKEGVGVLELLTFSPVPMPTQIELSALEMLANLVALSVKGAQLQAHQQRLAAIDAVSTAITSASSLPEMLRDVLDLVLSEQVTNAPAGAILLYDLAQVRLTYGAAHGVPDTFISPNTSISTDNMYCEDALRYSKPIHRRLISDRAEAALVESGLESGVYLPLQAGGTVVGLLCLYGDATLHERVDIRALSTLSNLIGFAVANVTLYDATDLERRRLTAVINSMAEGVMLCDRQGALVLMNTTARNILAPNYSLGVQEMNEMLTFFNMRNERGEPLALENMPFAKALRGNTFYSERIIVLGANDNDIVLECTGAPVYRDDGVIEGGVVIFRDITAQHRRERDKDDFLALAAHELRSPLVALTTFLQYVRRPGTDQRFVVDNLKKVYDQVDHMNQMVNTLLDLKRIEQQRLELSLQDEDIVALVQQVVGEQTVIYPQHIISLVSHLSDVRVICDRTRIRQVVTNMVSNACRYSQVGSQVLIVLDVRNCNSIAQQHATFAARRHTLQSCHDDTPLVLIAVQDHGAGMSDDMQRTLFNRYGRTPNPGSKGLGLGLYMSYEYVLRHHGLLWADSREGSGSTFYMALPLSQSGSLPAEPAALLADI